MEAGHDADSAGSDDMPPSSQGRWRSVPPSIRAVATPLIERRAASAVADLRWRYDLGAAVRKLRYLTDDRCPHELEALARVLRVDQATLRRYARVASVISADELAEYISLSRNRLTLTWSHLEELAKCRNKGRRRQCASEVILEALSVLQLVARLRGATRM